MQRKNLSSNVSTTMVGLDNFVTKFGEKLTAVRDSVEILKGMEANLLSTITKNVYEEIKDIVVAKNLMQPGTKSVVAEEVTETCGGKTETPIKNKNIIKKDGTKQSFPEYANEMPQIRENSEWIFLEQRHESIAKKVSVPRTDDLKNQIAQTSKSCENEKAEKADSCKECNRNKVNLKKRNKITKEIENVKQETLEDARKKRPASQNQKSDCLKKDKTQYPPVHSYEYNEPMEAATVAQNQKLKSGVQSNKSKIYHSRSVEASGYADNKSSELSSLKSDEEAMSYFETNLFLDVPDLRMMPMPCQASEGTLLDPSPSNPTKNLIHSRTAESHNKRQDGLIALSCKESADISAQKKEQYAKLVQQHKCEAFRRGETKEVVEVCSRRERHIMNLNLRRYEKGQNMLDQIYQRELADSLRANENCEANLIADLEMDKFKHQNLYEANSMGHTAPGTDAEIAKLGFQLDHKVVVQADATGEITKYRIPLIHYNNERTYALPDYKKFFGKEDDSAGNPKAAPIASKNMDDVVDSEWLALLHDRDAEIVTKEVRHKLD